MHASVGQLIDLPANMARPLRLHIPGMLYHVMSRGNAKQAIFTDDSEYEYFLERLEVSTARFGIRCPAYCLMPNHLHLVLEPRAYPISRLMQHLNSAYCLWFNRRHRRVGHVLQGRFKSILVDSDGYFLRLLRYVLRNPVRANRADHAVAWRWSSCRATFGLTDSPDFLDIERVWRALDAENPGEARQRLMTFLADASDDRGWDEVVAIGSAAFRQGLEPALRPSRENEDFLYSARFASRPSLAELLARAETSTDLERAMRRAFYESAYTLRDIGRYLGRPTATVWAQIHRVRLGVRSRFSHAHLPPEGDGPRRLGPGD